MATRETSEPIDLSRRSLLTGLGMGVSLAGIASCSPPSGSTGETGVSLRLALADNTQSPYFKGAEAVAAEVAKSTSGRVTINVIPGGAVGDERSTVEMVQNNDLDIAVANNSVISNWIPEIRILDQAFLWNYIEEVHNAVDGEVGEMIYEAVLPKRMRVIGYMDGGFRNIVSTRPVTDLSDFTGLKIRTIQNAEQIKAFDWLGAMPVAMPVGDQFTALQQGTIDAVENATATAYANRWDEVTQDITETAHAFVYLMLMMSEQAWERIPTDLRGPFIEAVTDGCHQERVFLAEADIEAKEELSKNGVQFHQIDRESLVETIEARRKEESTTFEPAWQAAVDRIHDGEGGR